MNAYMFVTSLYGNLKKSSLYLKCTILLHTILFTDCHNYLSEVDTQNTHLLDLLM